MDPCSQYIPRVDVIFSQISSHLLAPGDTDNCRLKAMSFAGHCPGLQKTCLPCSSCPLQGHWATNNQVTLAYNGLTSFPLQDNSIGLAPALPGRPGGALLASTQSTGFSPGPSCHLHFHSGLSPQIFPRKPSAHSSQYSVYSQESQSNTVLIPRAVPGPKCN